MATLDAASFPTGFAPGVTWEKFEVEPGIEVRYPRLEPSRVETAARGAPGRRESAEGPTRARVDPEHRPGR